MTETITRRAFGAFVFSAVSLAVAGAAKAARQSSHRTHAPITVTMRADKTFPLGKRRLGARRAG